MYTFNDLPIECICKSNDSALDSKLKDRDKPRFLFLHVVTVAGYLWICLAVFFQIMSKEKVASIGTAADKTSTKNYREKQF